MTRETTITVAAVQMAPRFSDKPHNRGTILNWLREAASLGADLVVFPECALSGYVFESLEEAQGAAEAIPGPTSTALAQACADLGVWTVVGMLEAADTAIHNSVLLMGPGGPAGVYRKTHLPVLGVDRFARPGNMLEVVQTPVGVLGPLICYDLRFPEAPRVLALKGAEIIVHATNWPRASGDFPDFVTKAAARASGVFVISANRVGTERGTDFLGRSQIIPPSGRPLVEADGDSETIIIAEIELEQARRKKVVHIPGVFELDSFGDRRPELYGMLASREWAGSNLKAGSS
jgi:predicted amidohydrolase